MDNIQAYNEWADKYDTVINKTRDLEGIAFRSILSLLNFETVLEIGCGTGKNTVWLLNKASVIVAADFSEAMLAKAKEKIQNDKVKFITADVRERWPFEAASFDLVTFSLVLEHIENIDFIFSEAQRVLKPGGILYIGELHPYKQYAGSKARFDTGNGTFELECFIHSIAAYFNTGKHHHFDCITLSDWFDDENNTTATPRLLTMVFKLST